MLVTEELAKRFAELEVSRLLNFGMITTLRRGTAATLPALRHAIEPEMSAAFGAVRTKEHQELLDSLSAENRAAAIARLVQVGTEMEVRRAQAAANSASLVLAHSVLDDAATQYLRICAEVAPEDWESSIKEKQISLARLKDAGSFDAALALVLRDYIAEVERKKSLMKRIELICSKCQPMPDEDSGLPNYKLNLEAIEKLDKRRQDIVHRIKLDEEFQTLETDIQYLHDTCQYLSALVSHKYGLKVDAALKDAVTSSMLTPQPGSLVEESIAQILRIDGTAK